MWIDDYRLVAHRGLHDNATAAPENSLPAFARAVARGHGVELDVHVTLDGELVVFHDNTLARMTGAEGVLEDQTLEELRGLRLLQTDCRIPLLSEVLAVLNGQVPLILEIKNDFKANLGRLESRLIPMLEQYGGKVVLESFNPHVVDWLRAHAPQYVRGQLACEDESNWQQMLYVRHFLFNPLTAPQFIAYDIDAIDWKIRTACRRHGIPLIAWTVRTEQQLDKARRLCDGIIYEGLEL